MQTRSLCLLPRRSFVEYEATGVPLLSTRLHSLIYILGMSVHSKYHTLPSACCTGAVMQQLTACRKDRAADREWSGSRDYTSWWGVGQRSRVVYIVAWTMYYL